MRTRLRFLLLISLLISSFAVRSQPVNFATAMKDFDSTMNATLAAWNTPGAGVGIVVKGRLVFAKGYGYRDWEKKLPVTPNTLFQIASNTKLFTTVAAGMLVAEGKLDWDTPVRTFVPDLRFSTGELNSTVTLRDMLSHRTGISRHDLIWYKSDFSRQELFDRVKYLEPSQALRQGFLYNNMMYAAAGMIVEKVGGAPWEEFLRKKVFRPLEMNRTVFSIDEMVKDGDCFVPYNEKRDTTLLVRIPYYSETGGMGPAGSIISSVNDMSRWLIALMNGGTYRGARVIPGEVVKATLTPSIALPNTQLETRGYTEILNPAYGMGRWFASYRGHFLAYHGGDLDGIHSQISCMPYDSLGVIVFVIGDHSAPLYNVISYDIYERLLGMSHTPWSERRLADRSEGRAKARQARSKAGSDRVPNASPSHPLGDFTGEFENPAYGVVTVTAKDTTLEFEFHHMVLPLFHYHYDRFDTPNDEEYGLWSLNYSTNPQGDVDRVTISLDEAEATFVRRPANALSDPSLLRAYAGTYATGSGTFEVILKNDNTLVVSFPGQPSYPLIPVKPRMFRMKGFTDTLVEFVVVDGKTASLKQRDPSGEFEFKRVDDR